jgi:hypothetical protein
MRRVPLLGHFGPTPQNRTPSNRVPPAGPSPSPGRALAARCGSAAQNSSLAAASPPHSAGILWVTASSSSLELPRPGWQGAHSGSSRPYARRRWRAGQVAEAFGGRAPPTPPSWSPIPGAWPTAGIAAASVGHPGGETRACLAVLRCPSARCAAGPPGAVRKRAPGARTRAARDRCGSAGRSPAGAARNCGLFDRLRRAGGAKRRRCEDLSAVVSGAPRHRKPASRRGGSTPRQLDRVFPGAAPSPLASSRPRKEPSRPRRLRPGRLGEVDAVHRDPLGLEPHPG